MPVEQEALVERDVRVWPHEPLSLVWLVLRKPSHRLRGAIRSGNLLDPEG